MQVYWNPPVHLSALPSLSPSCPLCYAYRPGWILSLFGTSDHYHKQVCHAEWPLTLAAIFKVIQSLLCSETAKTWHILPCPLHRTYSSWWNLSYLAQIIITMRGCVTGNDLWPWSKCSRSFSCECAIKLLKYGTSYDVCSTAHTMLFSDSPF